MIKIPEAQLEPIKHLRGSSFAKIVNGIKPLTIFAKIFILNV